MEEIIFTETTTIGIRRNELDRTILRRSEEGDSDSCRKSSGEDLYASEWNETVLSGI